MSQIVADLLLLLVTVIWGTTFVVVKEAIEAIKPFTFIAVRFLVGGLFLLVFVLLRAFLVKNNSDTAHVIGRQGVESTPGNSRESSARLKIRQLNREFTLGSVITGVTLFLAYATQTVGLITVPAGKAAFITGLSVVMVPVASAFLLKSVPPTNTVFGVVLATIGLGFMSLTFPVMVQAGDVLVFLCAIGFAAHILLIEKYSKENDPLLFAAIQLLVVSFGAFVAAVLFEWPLTIPKDSWASITYTAIIATSITILIQSGVQKYTTATHAALILSCEPVFGAFFAWLKAGEILSTREIWGAILIVAGMVISEIGSAIKPSERFFAFLSDMF
jgi:drug/metabolite transporter (DMT)-like permease